MAEEKPWSDDTKIGRMDAVDVVGLSCRFPQSNTPTEFWTNLKDGIDMVTEDDTKWPRKSFPEVPARFGKLKENEYLSFDASFFQVHGKQAARMEPQLYKLLEVSWEAWQDSGIDVRSLRDSDRVGVYCGAVGSEVHGGWLSTVNEITGYEQTGCVMNMLAGRLSFFYSFRGPSKYVDTACSSSAIAMHDAIADMTANRIDYALVVGASCINAPTTSLAFHRLHMLSPEGACKAFDASGNGYCRAEGVAAVVLVRTGLADVPRFAALSPYTTVLNAGTNNDGWTKEGITFPNQEAQKALERRVCMTGGVDPATIVYIEAHGTGTVAGDGQELSAVDSWYGRAPGRKVPVKIGSVKSNMGHCEGASGLAGLIKVCLAYETGLLPKNLHYHRDTPNPTSAGLKDGTLQVVDETQPWEGGKVALSSFGFSGSNVHMVMEAPSKRRQALLQATAPTAATAVAGAGSWKDGITPMAARTPEGLALLAKAILEAEAETGVSLAEPLRRYANISAKDLRLNQRGTLVNGELKTGATKSVAPQVWFAFSGNGSQWPKMGLSLLEGNPTFRRSVQSCAAVLVPKGIDLMAEFRAEKGWKTPLLGAVGLIAVQIGLVDVLKEDYGIVPDGMMGHSAGEIACTYASGCCTAEQAMLIAYHRGRLPIEHGINNGLMAATGLSAEQAIERCQGTNVVLACDNSPISTTISGPAEDVRAFVKQLDAESIFARTVDTNGVPYHSPALEPLLAELAASLRQVIPEPVKRPAGWVSAAFPADSTKPEAQMCSAGYQVHSYRNPVLFTAAAGEIPNGSVVVEIGPHSILRSPLRQTRPDLGYVGAMRKGDCGLQTVAAAVADLWRRGAPVSWHADPVPKDIQGSELPRSVREALTSWDRNLYGLPKALTETKSRIYEKIYHLGGEHAWICDHEVDGMVFVPMACFLVTAWEAFAHLHGKTIWELPVEFTDVNVVQPVRAERDEDVTLWVITDNSNHFQVMHGEDLVTEGVLNVLDAKKAAALPQPFAKPAAGAEPTAEHYGCDPEKVAVIPKEDWYKQSARHNINYGPWFQMVERYGIDGSWTDLKWKKNWTIHLDGYFQTNSRNDRGDLVKVARGIRRLSILDTKANDEDGSIEHVNFDLYWGITRSPSVVIEGYNEDAAPIKNKPHKRRVGAMKFMPYGERASDDAKRTKYARQLNGLAAELLGRAVAGGATHLEKARAALEALDCEPLSEAEKEELTASDHTASRLAGILSDVLDTDRPFDLQEAVLRHPDWATALKKDLVLNSFGKVEMGLGLALAVCNQSAVGYNVCEIGMSDGSFTRKALKSFVGLPNSSLLRYTATADNLSGAPQDLQHDKLKYQEWDFNKPSAASPGGPFNIIIAKHLSAKAGDLPAVLATLYDNLNYGGFVVLEELVGPLGAAVYGLDKSAWEHTDGREFGPCTSVAHWQRMLADAGLTECGLLRCPAGSSASFLYRKLRPTVPRSFPLSIVDVRADNEAVDAWIKGFFATMDAADATDTDSLGSVWLYGDLERRPGVLGFVHSARKEPKGDRVRGILSWGPLAEEEAARLVEQCRRLDLVDNVFKNGVHGAYVPVKAEYDSLIEETEAGNGCHMDFATYGNLKSIVWKQNPPLPEDRADVVSCDVAFGALNFRDVMLAYGKLSRNQMAHDSGGDNIGFEFSGTVEGSGKRVMGSAKNAIATKIATRPDLVWEVPAHWSLAEAATVPTAYMTAYYSLVMRGRLRKGMRVLIHSGTGAVGLAAIQICLNRGAEVFATCGTPAKKAFLLEAFPGLKEANIGDSRSTSFEGVIRNRTQGRGVHLVLNSLSDDKLQASVRCIGRGGKLLEIGKYDILKGSNLSMRPMLDNIAFEGIDVDRVMNDPDHAHELEEVNELVLAGIQSGEVRPLPVTVFKRNETEEAFRYLAKGLHIGKCVLDMSASPKQQSVANCLGPSNAAAESAKDAAVTMPPLQLQPVFSARPDRSYIITGGVGGFGLALAEYLAVKGAKHLVLTSKRGLRHGGQAAPLRKLFAKGVEFKVTTLDVAVREEAEKIVEIAEGMAPVGGIFHLAMTLTDKMLANQTGEGWNACLAPKAIGAYNLDKISRKLPHLEHFVMWSSFVANAGNEGQTNYGYANACEDLLAETRKEQGLPALSIQWGVIDGVGVADAHIQELMQGGLLGASLPQPVEDCLNVVGRMMCGGPGHGAVMSSTWQPMDVLKKSTSGGTKGLLEAVLGVMGVRESDVTETDTLSNLGIDSMQLVEVRANLQRAMGRPVALEEVSGITIAGIKALEEPATGADATPAVAPAQLPAPESPPQAQKPPRAKKAAAEGTPPSQGPGSLEPSSKLPEAELVPSQKLGSPRGSINGPDTPCDSSEADASEFVRAASVDVDL